MQCLSKRISGFVLFDVTPQEVDDFFTARFSANSEKAEQRKRFTPSEGGGSNASRVL
jgi:hypothetical protein